MPIAYKNVHLDAHTYQEYTSLHGTMFHAETRLKEILINTSISIAASALDTNSHCLHLNAA